MRLIFLTLCSLLVLHACKNSNTKIIQKELIVLNPDAKAIKKEYHKYSTHNPFHPDYHLYSPIEPSKKEQGKAKILISIYDEYNFQHLKNYIRKNGIYESYILNNDTILYRHFIKTYDKKESKRINNLADIQNYFHKNNIGFRLFKDKHNEGSGYTFLLNKNNIKDSALCTIFPKKDELEVYLYYNVRDTLKSLSRQSVNPYYGKEIED
ncbi:hypothetical protein [Chryseobacterium sp. ERMR1:04]|uniref:hypothetical protein n=1 Tax=Chryseobacterium sp. ERMR1:04 TaxID=1705393 RepID=UPI0006C8A5F6|nr:hypothetical protein [Chryseobacterium sp. ERMR1:04]KPH11698.1 hypothetical protein AMQ68_20195 [Chryseobacterium sp. ERMR1:04]